MEKGRVLKITSPSKTREKELCASGAEAERMLKEKIKTARQSINLEVAKNLNLDKVPIKELDTPAWREKIEASLKASLSSLSEDFSEELKGRLYKDAADEIFGLGPIEDLLKDNDVSEIMVNGKDSIYVERSGRIEKTEKSFSHNEMILAVLDRILSPLGKRIDTSSPTVDARLKDGSRVNAVIEPLSLVGPVVTIRKFSKSILGADDLIARGSISAEISLFLQSAVKKRKNIIFSGGTGTGKTTLLNVASSFIDPFERIVTIEDSSELKLNQPHTIYLEARPPNIEGRGEVTIRDLVRNALRMRPDRIIVGECRGGEAIDMLQAMNTGHDGSMTTLHANSARDVLSRLETMVLMSGFDLPLRAIRDQIAGAINLIIHLSRGADGKRFVSSVTEVCGTENSVITTQELFAIRPSGAHGGHSLEPTGNIPKFFD